MNPLLQRWSPASSLRRLLRPFRAEREAQWPQAPDGVYLNPSDADFAAYRDAPLALTWQAANGQDMAGWQHEVRGKLRELLGMPSTRSLGEGQVDSEVVSLPNGFRRQTVYVQTAPFRHTPVTLVWDPSANSEAQPVMLCLQGHTSGAHISWGEARLAIDRVRLANGGDYAVQAVRRGHVAVCIEQIAFGERREQALASRWDHPCVDACNRALLLGRTVLGDRVADVMNVIDWLHARRSGDAPRMDTGRIRAMGNSAGGETALFSTALDPRIEAAIASGCVGSWRKTSGTRRTCPDTVIPGVLSWIEYSDVLALCAPRRLLVVSGVSDHIYPFRLAAECADEARRAYRALGAENLLRAVSGPAGHRFYPDIAWPAFVELLEDRT